MASKFPFINFMPLQFLFIFAIFAEPNLDETKCRRVGDRFVQDYIQYECTNGIQEDGGDVNFDNGIGLFSGPSSSSSLIGKPIGGNKNN